MGNRAHAQSFDLPDASEVWQTFPPVTLPPLAFHDAEGNALGLSDYKGHVLLVNLWATWCGPCRMELPTLAALAPKLKPFGGKILPISVNAEGTDAVQAYFAAQNIKDLPVLADPSGDDLNLLQSQGIPLTMVVRPDGKAVARLEGAADWNNQNVVNFLKGLTGNQRGPQNDYS